MSFCTVLNCMDGRAQLPVINYLKKKFNAEYVDSITEPGINLLLSECETLPEQIKNKIDISVNKHLSNSIAVVGHYDCAANKASDEEQKNHIINAARLLKNNYEACNVIGLWVNSNWEVIEIIY